MFFLHRLMVLRRRRKRANRLGIEFKRSAGWRLPEQALINGKPWRIRAPDDNGTKLAFLDIFLDDCYGIEHVSSQARTVLDVGAHVGFFSMHARDLCPHATIHAYEPNPAMTAYLNYQSVVGGFSYFNEAVGLHVGSVRVKAADDSVQSSTLADGNGTIAQVPFRECIERLGGCVDFLKLDCEGAEWAIFQDREAWRAVAYFGMEYHLVDGQTEQDVVAAVTGLGFRILRQMASGPTWGLLWARRNEVI